MALSPPPKAQPGSELIPGSEYRPPPTIQPVAKESSVNPLFVLVGVVVVLYFLLKK